MMKRFFIAMFMAVVFSSGCAAPPPIPKFTPDQRKFVETFLGTVEKDGKGDIYFTAPHKFGFRNSADMSVEDFAKLVEADAPLAAAACLRFFERAAASWENYEVAFVPGAVGVVNTEARRLLRSASRDMALGRIVMKMLLRVAHEEAGKIREKVETCLKRIDLNLVK